MTGLDTLHDLIQLLNESPGIAELSITGPVDSQITLKRSLAPSFGSRSSFSAELIKSEFEGSLEHDGGDDLLPTTGAIETILSNRVGIFRTARPSLIIGTTLRRGQIVGYIESMKLMNEVCSEADGSIIDVLVDDGTPVEYGQPLFRIASSLENE